MDLVRPASEPVVASIVVLTRPRPSGRATSFLGVLSVFGGGHVRLAEPGNAAGLRRSYATDGLGAPALQIASPLLGGLGGAQALTVHALTLELIEYWDQNAQPAGRILAREFV